MVGEFEGGVEDWLQQSQRSQALRDQRNTPPAATAAPLPQKAGRQRCGQRRTSRRPKKKLSYKGAARAGATARPHRRAGGRAAVHPARAGRWHALHPRPAARHGPARPRRRDRRRTAGRAGAVDGSGALSDGGAPAPRQAAAEPPPLRLPCSPPAAAPTKIRPMPAPHHLLIPYAASRAPGAPEALKGLALPHLDRLLARLSTADASPGEETSLTPARTRTGASAGPGHPRRAHPWPRGTACGKGNHRADTAMQPGPSSRPASGKSPPTTSPVRPIPGPGRSRLA